MFNSFGIGTAEERHNIAWVAPSRFSQARNKVIDSITELRPLWADIGHVFIAQRNSDKQSEVNDRPT
jgi:hypothetical protein